MKHIIVFTNKLHEYIDTPLSNEEIYKLLYNRKIGFVSIPLFNNKSILINVRNIDYIQ